MTLDINNDNILCSERIGYALAKGSVFGGKDV